MKRIISLILVLATCFLALTGCAFRYDKKDMSKYADFNKDVFYNALQHLSITLGDFVANPETRAKLVNDAVAKKLLEGTDPIKSFGGTATTTKTIGLYDSVYFCYYATDAAGNVFYAGKLDVTKPTNLQLGLSTVSGLNEAFQKALQGEDIKDHLYTTSETNYVKEGDIVSVSYDVIWDHDKDSTTPDKIDFVWNDYRVVTTTDVLTKGLLDQNAQVGVKLTHQIEETFTEPETLTKNYDNVKVESIIKKADNRADKVVAGDTVYVSYVMSFDATPFEKSEGGYDLPGDFDKMNWTAKGGKIQVTVSYEKVVAQDAGPSTISEGEGSGEGSGGGESTPEPNLTFHQQLVGKASGSTTSSLTEKNVTINGKTVDVEYSNVKINWINKSNNAPITFTYTPYPDEYVEADKNEKTEKNVYGKAITLNQVPLTYYVFPVYYIDVADVISENGTDFDIAAEILLNKYFDVVSATQTQEHDHNEEVEHEHVTEFVFATLNDAGYKNAAAENKTLATLINELSPLLTTLTEKQKAVTSALSALTSAQTSLATTKYASDTDEYKALETTLSNKETDYTAAKAAEQIAEAAVNTKVAEILGCAKDGVGVTEKLVADYKTYQYDTLDAAFRADVQDKLATEITKLLKSSVTFNGKLPKKAVKNAYNALMDSYQYDFYEGSYSSTTSTTGTSTSTETNYAHYNGNFKSYLVDKVIGGSENGGMKEVKAAIQAQAEAAVQEIIYVYVFTQMVEEIWDTDLGLTKEEKNNIKENLEYQSYQILLYYGIEYEYDVESAYHGSQFDKVMEFLLESNEITNADGVKVDQYTHIDYNK